ncbi:MAG: hypothetical protein C4542_03370 [Dehalococcoidia bacterium]|nr:MAG: hypothetical protein C4542_03370 [Dehalococcoidia bacterium]
MKKHLLRSFDFRFGRASLLKPSVLALCAANLYPLVGVLFLGWNAFYLLLLFWMENIVIGFYTVIKMLLVPRVKSGGVAKLAMVSFFCIHYGMFTLVHGIFVITVFGAGFGEQGTETLWQRIVSYQLPWAVLALLASHGVSLFLNYIQRGEYKLSTLNEVMQQPYSRVVILHLTIIFGGFFVAMLGSPVVGLIILIALKIALDLRAHLQEHDKYTALGVTKE